MTVEIIPFIVTGVATGVTSALLVTRRMTRSMLSITEYEPEITEADSEFDAVLDEEAEAWAESTGRPEFGRFAASKLRTAQRIEADRRKARRRPRRWTTPW